MGDEQQSVPTVNLSATSVENNKLVWHPNNVARGNIQATLLGLQVYLKNVKEIEINFKDWKIALNNDPFTIDWYKNCLTPDNIELINQLLNSSDNNNILSIAVADTIEPIIKITNKWPNFYLDKQKFQLAMQNPNSYAAAIRWFVKLPKDWQNNKCDTYNSKYNGDLIQLSSINNNNELSVKVCKDKFGFITGLYSIEYGNFIYTIQLTDVTNQCCNPVPIYSEIIFEHNTEITHDPQFNGFKFNSFKIQNIENSMKTILGATNKEYIINAVQTNGIIQINKDTPLHADVCSVCVMRYRGCSFTPELQGIYPDFSHQDEGSFTNIIEIFIANKENPTNKMRMFDGIITQENTINSDE